MAQSTSFEELGRLSKSRTGKIMTVIVLIIFVFFIYTILTERWGLTLGGIFVVGSVSYGGYKIWSFFNQRSNFQQAAESLGVEKSVVAAAAEQHELTSAMVAENPSQLETTVQILDSMKIPDVKGRIATDRSQKMEEREEEIEREVEKLIDIYAEKALEEGLGPPLYNNYSLEELDRQGKEKLAKMGMEYDYSSDAVKKLGQGNFKGALTSAVKESAMGGVPETPKFQEAVNLDPPESIPYHIKITDLGCDLPFNLASYVDISSEQFDEPKQNGDLLEFDIYLKEKEDHEGYKIKKADNFRFIHEDETPILEKVETLESEIEKTIDSLKQASELQDEGVLSDSEYQEQFKEFLSTASSMSPEDMDKLTAIERLDVYKDAGTISDETFHESKTLLLDPQSVIVNRTRDLNEEGIISDLEYEKVKQTLT